MSSGVFSSLLIAGRNTYLHLNVVPVASGAAHVFHGPTISGSGTGKMRETMISVRYQRE